MHTIFFIFFFIFNHVFPENIKLMLYMACPLHFPFLKKCSISRRIIIENNSSLIMILCFPDKTQKERLKPVKLYIYSYIGIITFFNAFFFNTFQKNYSIASIALSKGQKVIEVKVSQERVTNKIEFLLF